LQGKEDFAEQQASRAELRQMLFGECHQFLFRFLNQ